MHHFFVDPSSIEEGIVRIVGTDLNHMKNVLRMKPGEEVLISDGTGKDYNCQVKEYGAEEGILVILSENADSRELPSRIWLFQGLPKSDKMELIIQKSVELGANSIIPVNMKRCVVKLEGKDEIKKNERWQKIAESAAKQCGRSFIPEVKHLINVKEICNWINEYDVIIVAYENEKENTLKAELKKLKATDLKIGIVIGPEGGFEESDIKLLKESGAKIVTLGDRILRTETVALNVLSIIMYEFEQ